MPEVAIEVELTAKDSRKLEGIIEELCLSWPAVVYLSPSKRILTNVQAAYDRLVVDRRVESGRLFTTELIGVPRGVL